MQEINSKKCKYKGGKKPSNTPENLCKYKCSHLKICVRLNHIGDANRSMGDGSAEGNTLFDMITIIFSIVVVVVDAVIVLLLLLAML